MEQLAEVHIKCSCGQKLSLMEGSFDPKRPITQAGTSTYHSDDNRVDSLHVTFVWAGDLFNIRGWDIL